MLPRLPRDDLRETSGRRARGSVRAQVDRLRRAADGVFPAKQTSHVAVRHVDSEHSLLFVTDGEAPGPRHTGIRPAYAELVQALPDEPRLNGDESPTKEGSVKSWLWTFVAGTFTVFALRGSRAATAICELLGETFAGVMHCDRAKMYWQCGRLQWCWAHLKRDFQALIDSEDRQVQRLGRDLMRPTKELFRHWSRCRDGTITRRGFERLMQPIRQEIDSLLLRGVFSANLRLVGMCEELHAHREWLWTFLDVEGVEPTNNAAERALRHAVIWRKLSFGTQSAAGSRFVETLLTTIETCRQQQRNVFEFVTQAVEAHFHNQTPPSLLPGA